MLYGQAEFLTGDPTQVAAWLSSTPATELKGLASKVKARRVADLPVYRSSVDTWVRDCSRSSYRDDLPRSILPGEPAPNRQTRGTDGYKPPQVGAKDHLTVRDRLQYQARGQHLPYVRSAAYNQKVPSNKWTRADLRAHDDPYKLTSGNGMTINQDGLWTFIVKTDWSIGHAEVVSGAGQATRLMVNGSDVGLRDYLDDDAFSGKLPINTFTWTDMFRAGTTINLDVRSEGVGEGFTAVCNVYLRGYLVRCFDGEFDMIGFPLPPDPKPQPVPNPPIGGYTPSVPSQPAKPQYPGSCGGDGIGYQDGYTVSSTGQVGTVKCRDGQITTEWSSYGWNGGQYYGGGTVGASVGGPGRFPGSW
ncbi:hypothetical protein GCM10010149_89190 [Nonomuraea roseoviolacea subsp. roseoviolacea]|uniref:hypothetical protein n=1 Tax=Nonomuraea roseoviolacea TaxID=103837 RepID=UPI0031D852D3